MAIDLFEELRKYAEWSANTQTPFGPGLIVKKPRLLQSFSLELRYNPDAEGEPEPYLAEISVPKPYEDCMSVDVYKGDNLFWRNYPVNLMRMMTTGYPSVPPSLSVSETGQSLMATEPIITETLGFYLL